MEMYLRGPGYGLEWLKSPSDFTLTGCEISREMISLAEKRTREYGFTSRANYVDGNCMQMPYFQTARCTNGRTRSGFSMKETGEQIVQHFCQIVPMEWESPGLFFCHGNENLHNWPPLLIASKTLHC
jgi:hypothetical protein